MLNLGGTTRRIDKSHCKRFHAASIWLMLALAAGLPGFGCQESRGPGAVGDKPAASDPLFTETLSSGQGPRTPRLLERRVFVRPGEPAVVFIAAPIRPADARFAPGDWKLEFGGPESQSADGRFARVSIGPLTELESNRRELRWLGDQLDWRCDFVDESELQSAAPGLWVAETQVPAGTRFITFGSRDVADDSNDDPHRANVIVVDDAPSVLALGERLLREAAADQLQSTAIRGADLSVLLAMLERVRVPVEQWRVSAVMRALEDRKGDGGDSPSAPPRLPPPRVGEVRVDPELRAGSGPAGVIARHVSMRWHAAIGRVGERDRAVAAALAGAMVRLIAVPDVGRGGAVGGAAGALSVMPLWPGTESGLADLQARLLESDPGEAVQIARAWLIEHDAVPLAWIVDDAGAGAIDPSSRSVMLACVNPAESPVIVSAKDVASGSAVRPTGDDLLAVPGRQARAGALRVALANPGQPGQPVELAVSLGQRSASRGVSAALTPAEPTLALGPLKFDWTMSTLRAFARPDAPGITPVPPAADAAWLAGATILYSGDTTAPIDQGTFGPPGNRSPWTLFVECRRPLPLANDSSRSIERVRLSLGGIGKSRGVVVFDESGAVQGEFSGVFAGTRAIKTVREPGRWAAFVPIPVDAIEAGGIVRIGLERTDGRGAHSAWPRVMTPWQIESGRAAIGLRPW